MTVSDSWQAAGLPGTPPPVTEAELRALRDRLAGQADKAGLLDVAYWTIDTPATGLSGPTGHPAAISAARPPSNCS
jgi:hypothetical protein